MTQYLNATQAAKLLGYAPKTLRNSRATGILAGVPCPIYKKLGRSIRYDIQALHKWAEQFDDMVNTKKVSGG